VNEETLITWNASNMITIWLMALIGALLFMVISGQIQKSKGGNQQYVNAA
jgi:hypothetical protein